MFSRHRVYDADEVSFAWKSLVVVEIFAGIGNGGPSVGVQMGENIMYTRKIYRI